MIITQMAELQDLSDAKKVLTNFINHTQCSEYYMLLNKELSYYTVFHLNDNNKYQFNSIIDEIIACAKEVGVLKSVELTNNNAVEIWVTVDEKSYPLYLFDYQKGVVECR